MQSEPVHVPPVVRTGVAVWLGPGVAVLAVLMLAAVWFGWRPETTPLGFPLDDAWIHLVYGRQLALDGSLAFNSDSPSTGATSLLWAFLLGVVHLCHQAGDTPRILASVVLLGALFHVATAWRTARLAERLGGSTAGWVAGALVAISPQLAFGALSGMEVSLATLCWIVSLEAIFAGAWQRAGLVLALSALARPELAVVALLLFLFALFAGEGVPTRTERFVRAVRLAWPSLVVGIAVALRNVAVTGHMLPATYYVKAAMAGSFDPAWIGEGLFGTLARTPPLWGMVGWLTLLGLGRPGLDRRVWLLVATAFAFLLANLRVVPPHDPWTFYGVRYLLPLVPPLTIAMACSSLALTSESPGVRRFLPVAALVGIGLVGTAMTLPAMSAKLANDTRNIDELQVSAGRWIDAHVAPGAAVATNDAGAVRYVGNRWTLDMMGLNSPQLVWSGAAYAKAHPVQAVVFMPAWFQPQRPDVVQIAHRVRTKFYTVTPNTAMAQQWIATCPTPAEVRFRGLRDGVVVWCQPGTGQPATQP